MIYSKLAEIQKELFVPKGQHNDFGKFNYRSCEDILQAAKPICEAKGCVLFITNDMENIGDRNYVKATVTLVELETGEQLQSMAHAREEEEKKGMDGSQITGAASSYARKYALAGLFCIDNEKDSDATNDYSKATRRKETPEEAKQNQQMRENVDPVYLPTEDKVITTAQWNKLASEMNRTGATESYMCQIFNVKTINDMSQAQVITALNKFKNTPSKGKK